MICIKSERLKMNTYKKWLYEKLLNKMWPHKNPSYKKYYGMYD
jgi:hypothetical protein